MDALDAFTTLMDDDTKYFILNEETDQSNGTVFIAADDTVSVGKQPGFNEKYGDEAKQYLAAEVLEYDKETFTLDEMDEKIQEVFEDIDLETKMKTNLEEGKIDGSRLETQREIAGLLEKFTENIAPGNSQDNEETDYRFEMVEPTRQEALENKLDIGELAEDKLAITETAFSVKDTEISEEEALEKLSKFDKDLAGEFDSLIVKDNHAIHHLVTSEHPDISILKNHTPDESRVNMHENHTERYEDSLKTQIEESHSKMVPRMKQMSRRKESISAEVPLEKEKFSTGIQVAIRVMDFL